MSEFVFWDGDVREGYGGNRPCEQREEIVRCSDCAHASSACAEYGPDALYCIVMDGIMDPDGFCSFGERRGA